MSSSPPERKRVISQVMEENKKDIQKTLRKLQGLYDKRQRLYENFSKIEKQCDGKTYETCKSDLECEWPPITEIKAQCKANRKKYWDPVWTETEELAEALGVADNEFPEYRDEFERRFFNKPRGPFYGYTMPTMRLVYHA